QSSVARYRTEVRSRERRNGNWEGGATMLFRRLKMVALSLFATSKALAAGADAPVGLGAVEAHGFASQGFLLSSGNNYLAKSKSGSFEFSEIGLNFTNQLPDRLRFGGQLFAPTPGPCGAYG